MMLHPTDWSAASTARWNIGPDTRESRPTTIERVLARAVAHAPNPAANRATTSGVNASPTRPRTPDTLIISPSYTFRSRCSRRERYRWLMSSTKRALRPRPAERSKSADKTSFHMVRHSIAAVPEAPSVLVVQLMGVAAAIPPQNGRAHSGSRDRDSGARAHAHLPRRTRATHEAQCGATVGYRAQRSCCDSV